MTLSATAGSVVISGGEAVADAIVLNASNIAGGIDIKTGGGTLDIGDNVTGAVTVDSSGTITIGANSTGVDIGKAAVTTDVVGSLTVAEGFTVTSSANAVSIASTSQVSMSSSQAAANAIVLNASNVGGGIDVDAGTAGITIDTTGDLTINTQIVTHVIIAAGIHTWVSGTATDTIDTEIELVEESDIAFAVLKVTGGAGATSVQTVFPTENGAGTDLLTIVLNGSGDGATRVFWQVIRAI